MYYIICMKRLPGLVWDDWNREHIKKHGVTVPEVEEAYVHQVGKSDSYLDRDAFFGIAKNGRPIMIAVSYKLQKGPYVLSARIMSKKERRKYL